MSTPPHNPHHTPLVLDARERPCPYPVILLGRHARQLTDAATSTCAGQYTVHVWASDPAARYDVPAWSRMTGNESRACDESHAELAEGDVCFVVTFSRPCGER